MPMRRFGVRPSVPVVVRVLQGVPPVRSASGPSESSLASRVDRVCDERASSVVVDVSSPTCSCARLLGLGGKPTVTSQVSIGSPERVRELVEGAEAEEVRLKVEAFGALSQAQQLDAGIGRKRTSRYSPPERDDRSGTGATRASRTTFAA